MWKLELEWPVNSSGLLVASDRNTIPPAYSPEGTCQLVDWRCPEELCFRNGSGLRWPHRLWVILQVEQGLPSLLQTDNPLALTQRTLSP